MKLTKTFLNAVLFTCLGILLMLFYYMLYSQLNYLNKSSDLVIHTSLVKLRLEQTFSAIKDAETGQRGYLLTHDSLFLTPYFKAQSRYEENLIALDSLTADNQYQKKNIQLLNNLVGKRLNALNTSLYVGSRMENKNVALAPHLVEGKLLMDSIRGHMTVMGNLEDSLLVQRQLEKEHRTNIAPMWAFIFFAFAVAILLISFYRIRLDLVRQNKLSKELLSMNRDLANQKAFAELLVESSPDMIIALDKELKIIEWNKRSEENYRIKKEQILGKKITEVFSNYGTAEWMNMYSEVLKGKNIHMPKIKFQNKEGYGEIFVIPLRSPNKEVFGLISIARDISELVKATNSLQEKNEELERTNQELASFSYVASHDLQEPLRKIQGFIGRILDKDRESFSVSTQDYFNRVVSAANRMQSLIDALLDFSRTNTTEIVFVETKLSELLEEVKINLKESIEEKHVLINAAPLPVIPVIPVQFVQLLSNLISNAIKYSKPDVQPVIKIYADIVSGEEIHQQSAGIKKYHRITVEDNGIGFEQKYSHKIFELFQRLHGKTEFSGTGIGLAICKKIVQNHNGVIIATGKPGEGARFDIYFPVSAIPL